MKIFYVIGLDDQEDDIVGLWKYYWMCSIVRLVCLNESSSNSDEFPDLMVLTQIR